MTQIFWQQRADARRDAPCLFLDRDGVVVREVGYLHRVADVDVLPGAAAAVAAAKARGWIVGLVTNQAGIGRGYYDWEAFAAVQAAIAEALGPAPFDFVAACATHPEAIHDHLRILDHPWRKPNPGMLAMARDALGIDMAASAIVGDQASDLEAGAAAGVGRLVHVMTGHGPRRHGDVDALAAGLAAGRLVRIDGLADLPGALHWT